MYVYVVCPWKHLPYIFVTILLIESTCHIFSNNSKFQSYLVTILLIENACHIFSNNSGNLKCLSYIENACHIFSNNSGN